MALSNFIKNVASETAKKASKVADKVSASAKDVMSKSSFNLEAVTSNWNKFAEYYTGKNVDEILKDKAEKGGTELTYLTLILDEIGKLPNISTSQKISIRGAIGYLVSPLDYISDFIPDVGYSDDIMVLSSGVYGVSDIITNEIKEAALVRLKKFLPKYDIRDVQKVDTSIQVWSINLQKNRERVEVIKQTVTEQVQAIDQTIENVKNSEEYKQVVALGEQVGATTVKGAKVITGVQGYQDRQEAMDINAQAEQIKKYVEEHTEELRMSLNNGLEELGKIRLTALHNVVGRFVDCLKKMSQGAKAKEYEFLSEIDLNPGHIQEMESLDMEAGDALKVLAVGGSFAAVGIAATPAIVTGVVTSLCAAGTGTAISTLSGAAANSAVLAWLGGGTIAAGGGGMAAGSVVLGALTGGVAIGAAVVAMGSLASAFYSRKLTEATKYLAAVQEWEAQTKQSWVALEAMKKRIEEIQTVTLQLESRASAQLEKLEQLIPTFNNDNIEHVEVFRQSAILAKSMSELAQVSLLDENGNLTSESSIVATKTEKLLNTNL